MAVKFMAAMGSLLLIALLIIVCLADNHNFQNASRPAQKTREGWPDAKPVSDALHHYFVFAQGGGNEAVVFGQARDGLMEALDNLSEEMPGNSAHTFTLNVPAYEAKKNLCPTAPETIGDGTTVLNYGGIVPKDPFDDHWDAHVYIDGSSVKLFMTR